MLSGNFTFTVLQCVYVTVNQSSEITKFRVTLVTNCRALTRSMNVSYVVSHERVSIFLFRRMTYIV
jgi:hypothetical protein